MNRPSLHLAILLAALLCTTCQHKIAEDPVAAEDPTGVDRLQWFKEAKFGMFIHWGPYSKIAGEWRGKTVQPGRNAEWAMKFLQIPREEYREMARDFNPVQFDARGWVQLAKQAGMRYLVITAKHHDGFAMYHSSVSEYNIVDWTPFERDPLKALARECEEADIRFCVYYSHREDWDEPFAYGNDWDFDFDPEADREAFEQNYVEKKAKPQLRELLTGYGPLGLIWFDRGMYTQQQGQEFVELVRNLQPQCLVNGRVGNYNKELLGDYQNMGDNGMPIGGIEEYWETPQTMNTTWGYSKFDHNWKTVDEIIERLVRIVGTGGNYLLNIGPDGEGSIPQPSVEILHGVGRWMQKYSGSIYGTTPSPFDPPPWGYTTVKDNKVFLHVFAPPASGRLTLDGLRTTALKAYPMAQPNLDLDLDGTGNSVSVRWTTRIEADPVCTVIVVELTDAPVVSPPVVIQQRDSVELNYLTAVTQGKAVKRFNRKGRFHISKFMTPEDGIQWQMKLKKPGSYAVSLSHSVHDGWSKRPVLITNGADTLNWQTRPTEGWYEYVQAQVGRLDFPESGRYTISLFPTTEGDDYLMYFKSLTLVPHADEP